VSQDLQGGADLVNIVLANGPNSLGQGMRTPLARIVETRQATHGVVAEILHGGTKVRGSGGFQRYRLIDRLRYEFWRTVFDIAKERGLDIDVVLSSERQDWIQKLVASGYGVSMIPSNSVVVEEGVNTAGHFGRWWKGSRRF
jgi:hypothetical protein